MHEQQLVAVGVARQILHGRGEFPESHVERGVAEHLWRVPRRGLAAIQRGEVEGARAQGPLEPAPAGWRMGVMEEGGGSEEAFLGNLALKSARRQVGVGLA